MLVTIISTFPNEGSRNVGDLLITAKTIQWVQQLREFKEGHCRIEVLWREDCSHSARMVLQRSDLIVFACLAIRPAMTRLYPMLGEILAMRAKLVVLAAGTSLPVGASTSRPEDVFAASDSVLSLLSSLSARSICFTTRDIYTQSWLARYGCVSLHTGDIAFYGCFAAEVDSRFAPAQPSPSSPIVISDPHSSKNYVDVLAEVIRLLASRYGSDSLVVAMHGSNSASAKVASTLGIRVSDIYKEGLAGLSIYDHASCHFGFRVHGHVSALSRLLPSYLLETDGRGSSYAATIPVSCSRACYKAAPSPSKSFSVQFEGGAPLRRSSQLLVKSISSFRRLLPRQDALFSPCRLQAPVGPAQELVTFFDYDLSDGFSRFDAIQTYVRLVNQRLDRALSAVQECL